ncbi:type IV secretion system protein [Salmonella enterica subsp. enterica]|nr:type IV secretion system protein [Salmonella enterica]EBP4092198.1 type IV secretion system protein [Salmonella enterica subsp. enterica]
MAETSDFFVTAKEEILSVLDASVSGQLTSFSNIAGTLGRYGVSIYVLWYAFTVLARKQQTPVPDFIWSLCRFSIILMFVQNASGWLNTSLVAIDGLKDSLAGNNDAWLWLDQLWTKVQQVAAHVMSKDTSTYVKTDGAIAALFTYFGGILALVACAIVFLAAEVTLKLLTVTAPVFIFCLMFGFLRQMFNSWLQLIFSSCLIFMFGSLALRAGTSFLNIVLSLAVDTVDNRNLIKIGATAAVAGIFMAWIIWQAKSYASQLAGVGVEGAMQGAAAMGIATGVFGASRMARGALGMGRNAGIGAWKGLRRQEGGFGQSPGITGKTANLAGQGVNIGAKKLRQAAIERAKKMYGG